MMMVMMTKLHFFMQIGPKKAPKDQKTFTYHLANFSPVFMMTLPRVILGPKNAKQQHKQCQNPKFYSKSAQKAIFSELFLEKLLIF